MAKFYAHKPFAIVTATGSTLFMEGQEVPEHIAKAYPQHIKGLRQAEKPIVHNPNLKEKLTKKDIAKMDEDTLKQWIMQFHPGDMPAEGAKKDELAEVVISLNA